MLILIVFATLICLFLLALGMMLPSKVFLGPLASREKVRNVYGIPALCGFVILMVAAPGEKRSGNGPDITIEAGTAQGTSAAETSGGSHSVVFQGFVLPGRMAEARAAGFTQCEAGFDGYQCSRRGDTLLMGIPAQSSTLMLDGGDHFADSYFLQLRIGGDARKIPEAELAYGVIRLVFSKSQIDWGCVDKEQKKAGSYNGPPIQCITNQHSIGHLRQALLDAGWVLTRDKGGAENFVHTVEQVEITIRDEVATVRRVPRSWVAEIVANDQKRRASASAAQANASQIVEAMRR